MLAYHSAVGPKSGILSAAKDLVCEPCNLELIGWAVQDSDLIRFRGPSASLRAI
jgi:hypothetical protein